MPSSGTFNGFLVLVLVEVSNQVKGTHKCFEAELYFYENILSKGSRILIPKELREEVPNAAHECHPGIVLMKFGCLRKLVASNR